MPRVRFERTILVSERVKTVHSLDRAAAVIGSPLRYGANWPTRPSDSSVLCHRGGPL
jgi:hypothetical protein